MNGDRLKSAFIFGVRLTGVLGPVASTLYVPLMISFESAVLGGELRRKSVRVPYLGSTVGSEIERPCVLGRSVPRSVSVSRFFSTYVSGSLCFLFKHRKTSRAARIIPIAMPGMKPAANDLPLKVGPDE